MQWEEFSKTISDPVPPAMLNQYALALWHDANGDWEKAHSQVQDIPGETAAWVHAYLHRKQGDEGNAGYWYHRAGKKMPGHSSEKEWEEIAKAVL